MSKQDFDLAGIDIVVNTHLHFDHCGGNHLFAGRPIYVQRRELDDARSEDDYTIREWVEAPGVRYVHRVLACPPQSNFVRHRGTEWCAGGSAITERVVVMFQHLADGWSIRTCQARPGI